MASFTSPPGQQMRRKNRHISDERPQSKLDLCILLDQSGSCVADLPTEQTFAKDLVRKIQRDYQREHLENLQAPSLPLATVVSPVGNNPEDTTVSSTTANTAANVATNAATNAVVASSAVENLNDFAPRYSVIGFGCNIAVQCPPTNDINQVITAIGEQQASGSTNTTGALLAAYDLLVTNGRHDAKKILVVVTDGCPNNQKTAVLAADKCKDANILVVAVTVGVSDIDNMKVLVSSPINKNLIQAESFASLPTCLNDLLSAVGAGKITIEPLPCLNPGVFEGGSGQPTMIRIKIKNKTSVTRSTMRIRVCESHQMTESAFIQVPVIQPNDSCIVEVPHEWKIWDIRETTEDFEYEIYEDTILLMKSSWKLSFADFTGGLHDFGLHQSIYSSSNNGAAPKLYTPERLNILFLGWQGSGKSTQVNTCVTAANTTSDNVESHEAKVIGRMEHATTSLNVHDLSPKLRIIDVPGLEENTYQGLELQQICVGLLEEGRELLPTTMQDDTNNLDQIQMNRSNIDQVHAVVVFFPVEMLQNQNSIKIVRAQLKKLESLDYNPIIMLAKCDLIVEEIRKDPLHFENYDELKRAKAKVAKLTGYPECNILHAVSYVNETRRSWKLDALAYHNMKTWIAAGRRRMDRLHEKGNRAKSHFDSKIALKQEADQRTQLIQVEREAALQLKRTATANQDNTQKQRVSALNNTPITTWMDSPEVRLAKYSQEIVDQEYETMDDLLSCTDPELNLLCSTVGMKAGSWKRFCKNIKVARAVLSGDDKDMVDQTSSMKNTEDLQNQMLDSRVQVENGGLFAALGGAIFGRFRSASTSSTKEEDSKSSK